MMMASYQLLQKAGYDVVPFSLTHPDKAVRYNPLQMVIENMRRGRMPQASTELSNLSSTFFPSTGGDDFWISTARSVFEMMTYQLMNYMIDEERRTIRIYQSSQSENSEPLVDKLTSLGEDIRPQLNSQANLDKYIDDLWGNVSMNSMYQMIAQLDVLKMPDSLIAAGDTKYALKQDSEEEPDTPEEVSGLDVLASAIRELPDNSVRRSFKGPDTMLRKASGSDATTGSIYATALQNMSFFVQETIKKLTTVSPKNGLNILDFPFPRRFSVRLDSLVMKRLHLGRRRFRAYLYKDPMFVKPYGDKKHDTIDDGAVESSGWIDFWFKKIPMPKTKQFYIKIDIYDVDETNIVITLYFAINKGYLLNEQGTAYVKDPVTGRRIIKDGTAFEVKPMSKERAIALHKAGKQIRMTQKHDGFVATKKVLNFQQQSVVEPIVSQTMFNYTEKPKALFLSIPPQIESQAKLALVLIDSIFNTSMGKGYEIRGDTQKPDYGTRYMLEELGNLKSNGAGIASLDSKLSIGLSANQQMTLVFQGMKQVSSVYGDEMYDIMKDNVGTIHYMLSEGEDTLKYVSGLSGITHKLDISSQSTSEVVGALDKGDGAINITTSKSEVPVISESQLAHLTDGESVVVTPTNRRDSMNRVTRTNPVFNTQAQLMPFAYAMFGGQDDAVNASGQGTAETASTIYSTVDSNPDEMVPDFAHILRVTVRQAMYYIKHRTQLEKEFISSQTPRGSEDLADVIMDALTYDIDINKELINEGLAPYMMLTDTEIINAYKNPLITGMNKDIAKQLLSSLGYSHDDLAVTLNEAVMENVATNQTPMYLDGLFETSQEFDDFFNDLFDESNQSEITRSLQDFLFDPDTWDSQVSVEADDDSKKVIYDNQQMFSWSYSMDIGQYDENIKFRDTFLDTSDVNLMESPEKYDEFINYIASIQNLVDEFEE